MRRALSLISLVILFPASLLLAGTAADEKTQYPGESDIKSLSSEKLEERLEELNREIYYLDKKIGYLETEEPEDFNRYSSRTVEQAGVGTNRLEESKLLNPAALKDARGRLKESHRLKEEIEKELDIRDKEKTRANP